jgi:hypothetical protein
MTPKQVFDDSFRMAELLIHVYRLLENDGLQTTGQLVASMRGLLECQEDEQIQLIVNAIFVGCIRENANVPGIHLRLQSLQNLLRQAVVSGCTAYETYLTTLLQTHIFTVIEVKQHQFFPEDKDVKEYFKGLSLTIGDSFRLLNDSERSVFLGQKIVSYVQSKNVGSVNGLATIGLLDSEQVKKMVGDALKRRNRIVHDSDRLPEGDGMEKQPIAFAWTQQAVDTIKHVCLGFDELVNARMTEYRAELAARNQES